MSCDLHNSTMHLAAALLLGVLAAAAPVVRDGVATVDEGWAFAVRPDPDAAGLWRHVSPGRWAVFGAGFGVYTAPNGSVVEWPPRAGRNRSDVLAIPRQVRNLAAHPFFPGCFPGDDRPHALNITLALDESLWAADRREVERAAAVARAAYQAQLNLSLRVAEVVRAPVNATGAIAAFEQFGRWAQGRWRGSGYHLLLSARYQGVSGVAYVGSICSSQGFGVSQLDWLDIAHELGHALGAGHTFGRGGIMDYADGRYEGEVQLSPSLREAVCPVLAWARDNCAPHFGPLDSGCGDGVLGPEEQCECTAVGSRACGACVGCRAPAGACSPLFAVRREPGPAVAVLGGEDAACCAGKPKTACGLGGVCSRQQCAPACSRGFGLATRTCGFDEMGCRQGCVFNGRCRWDLTVEGAGEISNAPNGTRCVGGGTCDGRGRCSAPACSGLGSRRACGARAHCRWDARRRACVVR